MSLSRSGLQTPPPAGEGKKDQLTPPATGDRLPSTPQKRGVGTVNQLLTPPSTGGLRKTVRFAEDHGTPTKSKRHFRSSKDVDETAFVEYVELDELSDLSDSLNSKESPVASNATSRTQESVTSQPSTPVHEEDVSINTKVETSVETTLEITTSVPTQPFSFMKLPLSVRKKIYEVLLVVPGLICVRQNHTSYHKEEKAFLYAEARLLLPGIEYALPQITVNGFKVRFSRFCYANAAILRASKEVYGEAKAVLYGVNDFEIICPSLEMSPAPDYKVPLFPHGCQRLVRSLSIRVRALYPLQWLLNGGYSKLKNAYRGLETLNIFFEMESGTKGLGKLLTKKEDEQWVAYVTRLHTSLLTQLFAGDKDVKRLPLWVHFRVLFPGDAYDDTAEPSTHNINVDMGPGNMNPTDAAEEQLRRYHLKHGLPEAFEMFKKGGN